MITLSTINPQTKIQAKGCVQWLAKNLLTGEYLMAPYKAFQVTTDDPYQALVIKGDYGLALDWLDNRLGDTVENYDLVEWA